MRSVLTFGGRNSDAPSVSANSQHVFGHDDAWTTASLGDGNNRTNVAPMDFRAVAIQIACDAAPTGATKSWSVQLYKNGSAVGSAATLTDAEVLSAKIPMSVSVAAGDIIYLRCTPANTPSAANLYGYIEIDADDQQGFPALACTSGTITNAWPIGVFNWAASNIATAAQAQQIVPIACKIKNLRLRTPAGSSGGANQYVVTLYVNGASTALTVGNVASNAVASNTSDEISVAAGDLVHWDITPNTPGTARSLSVSAQIIPDDPALAFFSGHGTATASGAATRYNNPNGSGQAWTATESLTRMLVPALNLKQMRTNLEVAASGGGNWGLSVLRNADTANPALTHTISSGSSAGASTATEVPISDGDTLGLRTVPSSVTASRTRIGTVYEIPERQMMLAAPA